MSRCVRPCSQLCAFTWPFSRLLPRPLPVPIQSSPSSLSRVSRFHSIDPHTVTSMAQSLSEAGAATALSADCQETCCLRWKKSTLVFLSVRVPPHSLLALVNRLQPWVGIYSVTACKGIGQRAQTQHTLHNKSLYSCPATTSPRSNQTTLHSGIQDVSDSTWYELFAGVPSKASWHLGFFEVKYLCDRR